MESLFVIMILSAVAIIFGASFWNAKKVDEAWAEAASQLGLELDAGGWFSEKQMAGLYRGRQIRCWIRSESRGSGKNRSTVYFTAITADLCEPYWQGVSITRRTLGTRIATFFGGEDIEVGNFTLDKEFRFQGLVEPGLASRLQESQPATALQGLSKSFHRFKVDAGMIEVQNKERVNNAARLVRLIDRVVDAAIALDPSTEQPQQQEASHRGRNEQEAQDLFPDIGSSEQPIEQDALW